jgi:hypothetical protein
MVTIHSSPVHSQSRLSRETESIADPPVCLSTLQLAQSSPDRPSQFCVVHLYCTYMIIILYHTFDCISAFGVTTSEPEHSNCKGTTKAFFWLVATEDLVCSRCSCQSVTLHPNDHSMFKRTGVNMNLLRPYLG